MAAKERVFVMKKIFIYLILAALVISWSCSKENNPVEPSNEEFSGILDIKTKKVAYYINEDFSNSFALITATLFNTSSDTLYAKLGDGYITGIEQDKLLIAEGSDGYFEKNISDNSWMEMNRGVLIEGCKAIRILPGTKYDLDGTAYIDSNTAGKFRLRINYFKSFSQPAADKLSDTSNAFFIYKR